MDFFCLLFCSNLHEKFSEEVASGAVGFPGPPADASHGNFVEVGVSCRQEDVVEVCQLKFFAKAFEHEGFHFLFFETGLDMYFLETELLAENFASEGSEAGFFGGGAYELG